MSRTRDKQPPGFPELFARALALSAARRSYLAYIPWWLMTCLAIPILAYHLMGSQLPAAKLTPLEAVTMLSSIAVVGGFLGSASVSIAGQLQRMISEYPFSDYLKEEDLFDTFLFWPQFTLSIQIINISLASIFSIMIFIFGMNDNSALFVLLSFSLLIYTFSKTWNLIDTVRIVTWHYEDYKHEYESFVSNN